MCLERHLSYRDCSSILQGETYICEAFKTELRKWNNISSHHKYTAEMRPKFATVVVKLDKFDLDYHDGLLL
jgi:hypothetical protein